MSNRVEPKTLKGFKDYLPAEQSLRQRIGDICREVFVMYGFLPLDTPALEYAETLQSKIGDDEKLIYQFEDNGGRQVAMRYDLTVPLARVVAQYQNEIKLPFKRFQIGKSWRADNPQKGRFREFIQADADIVGVESRIADAECIAIYFEIFSRLGIEDYKILINTREVFDALGKKLGLESEGLSTVIRYIDKLDKISQSEVLEMLAEKVLNSEQIEVLKAYLDAAVEDDRVAALNKFFAGDDFAKEALARFAELQKYLAELGVPESVYKFDPSIARGLDYYTGTVFEVRINNSEVGSVGGGGRYDDLVEAFLGTKIPAVGMSVGVDRILTYLLEKNSEPQVIGPRVLVLNMGPEATEASLKVLRALRQAGVAAEYFYDAKDKEKQFKYAEALNIPYAAIVGSEELANGKITIRDLKTREQNQILPEDIVDFRFE